MAGSIERVIQAAAEKGLDIEVKRMGASTRTAEEAATECGCDVAQIVKSLIFEGENSGRLFLFLVGGRNQLDLDKAATVANAAFAAEPRALLSAAHATVTALTA